MTNGKQQDKNEVTEKVDNTTLIGKCPYVTVQKVLTGKWTLLILHHLEDGPLRFKELERLLAPITQATLTKQLRTMEGNGLICRKVYNQIPPKVEYSLSPIGLQFKDVLKALQVWGEEYIDFMHSREEEAR